MSGQGQPSNQVSSVYNELRMEGTLTDAVLKVGDDEFPVHKIILCNVTSYFRALFTRWSKQEQTIYSIEGMCPDTMRLILDYVYTGSLPITENNVQEILLAADQFNILEVIEACSNFLIELLQLNNCISIWKFTNVCFHTELRCKAFRYILEHFEKVCLCDEFLLLSVEELIDIIKQDNLNVRQENIVFEAILRWIDHTPEERERHFHILLKKVRLALVDITYITTTVMTNALVQSNESCLSIINTAIKAIKRIVTNRAPLRSISNSIARPRLPSTILLAIGGWSGGDPTNGIEAYNIRADRWTNVTIDCERPRAYHGTTFLKGYIYCVGGFDRVEHFNSVRRFDPVLHTWHEVSPMYYRRCYVSVTVLNGCIYALGGYDGHNRLNTAEYYCPEINQWSIISPMHEQRSDASCTTLQNKVYICGGFNGQECLETAEFYNPETNQWTLIAPMNSPRSGIGVVAYGGHVYAVGGFDGNSRQQSVEAYDPQTNSWRYVASMITPRSNFGIEIVEDRLYVIGGFNGFTTTYNVEYYSHENNVWSSACNMEIFRSAVSCCVIAGLPNMAEYVTSNPQLQEVEMED
ncbi:kelch-like protein 10 [Nematolebias whitei]|uniref:kelch-like protein 10 n=1 Tax=Nematolebias whitei TaxID=451745 RepID=UPI00189A1B95|nr:kelch-like protein 10 [Nematolebias whitei]